MTIELKEETLLETIRQLQTELADLRQKVARLEDHAPVVAPPTSTSTSTSRRRMLGQLGKALLVAGAGVGAVAIPSITQARVVSGSNPGALILRNGATTSGTLPAHNYGLIASSDTPHLVLDNLLDGDTGVSGLSSTADSVGVFGFGTGAGVLGYSSDSIGVHAVSDSYTAIFGESTSGTGLQANSSSGNGVGGTSDSGRGGYFYSTSNFGCEVQSGSSVPLRLYPGIGDTPPGAVTAIGAIWSDNIGNLFAYTSSGWRQIQFVAP